MTVALCFSFLVSVIYILLPGSKAVEWRATFSPFWIHVVIPSIIIHLRVMIGIFSIGCECNQQSMDLTSRWNCFTQLDLSVRGRADATNAGWNVSGGRSGQHQPNNLGRPIPPIPQPHLTAATNLNPTPPTASRSLSYGHSFPRESISSQASSMSLRFNLSFDEMLSTPQTLRDFKSFCTSEFNAENILFYEDWLVFKQHIMERVDQLKQPQRHSPLRPSPLRNNESSLSCFLPDLISLYNTYIAPNAPLELNLSHETRQSIAINMQRGEVTDLSCLDCAAEEVRWLMVTYIFPQFCKWFLHKRSSH